MTEPERIRIMIDINTREASAAIPASTIGRSSDSDSRRARSSPVIAAEAFPGHRVAHSAGETDRRGYRVGINVLVTFIPYSDIELGLHATRRSIPTRRRRSYGSRDGIRNDLGLLLPLRTVVGSGSGRNSVPGGVAQRRRHSGISAVSRLGFRRVGWMGGSARLISPVL